MPRKPNPTNKIIGHYTQLYEERFGVKPKVNGAWCGKMIKNLLQDYDERTVIRIIDLFFEDPFNQNKAYHLPTILSSWSVNKYLPKTKDNPLLYED